MKAQIYAIFYSLFFLISAGIFSHAKAQDELPPNAELLDPLAFLSKKINLKHTLIDLRSEEAFKNMHIEGARNIPFQSSTFKKITENLPMYSPVLLYCDDGIISVEAANILSKAGFKTTILLEGGLNAWTEKRLKTVTKN